MSALVDRIEGARHAAEARARALSDGNALKPRLTALSARLEDVRKKIVATKEGGAITGEERIREHADLLYSALLGWEGKPARYQLDRIDALRRELGDVAKEFADVEAKEIQPLNQELSRQKLAPIPAS
jgi:hypothetical protein